MHIKEAQVFDIFTSDVGEGKKKKKTRQFYYCSSKRSSISTDMPHIALDRGIYQVFILFVFLIAPTRRCRPGLAKGFVCFLIKYLFIVKESQVKILETDNKSDITLIALG